MATTAKLIDVLASTLTDANGDPWSGYQVRTYASDGTTPAVVWEDRAKTLPDAGGKSQFTLSTSGKVSVYGDNTYVIKVWTATATPGVDDPVLSVGPVTYDFDTTGDVIGDVIGDVTGDVKAADGTTVLDSGTDGTDAEMPEGIGVDTIREKTAAAGVTIDGVLLKDSEVTTDTINEKTGAAGVTIDGVLCKDSVVTADLTGTADDADSLNVIPVSAAETVGYTLTATITTFLTLDLGTVSDGDVFMVSGWATMASGGVTTLVLGMNKDSGTATMHFINSANGLSGLSNTVNALASVNLDINYTTYIEVTGDGTLVLALRALSTAATGSIAANKAAIGAVQLRNV